MSRKKYTRVLISLLALVFASCETGKKFNSHGFDGEARLELMQWNGIGFVPTKLQDKTYFHLSVSVGSKEQVDAMTARLQTDGYTVKSGPRTTGDGYYESVIALWDGIEIEITI